MQMGGGISLYLNDTTSHPLVAAYLHILEPRNPFPPATTIFLLAAFVVADAMIPRSF